MAMRGYTLCSILVFSLFASCVRSKETKEFVLTLDHTNFTETINKHDFIVVEFYAPWYSICNDSTFFFFFIDMSFLCVRESDGSLHGSELTV